VQDMEVELDEERRAQPVDPDDPFGEQFSLRVGGGRNVTLTLPNGRRTTFLFALEPGQSDTPDQPCFCYRAKWIPVSGTYASLAPIDNNTLQFIPWQTEIQPYWTAAGPETPLENFDFRGFVLTNGDGTEYHITRDDGGEYDLEPQGNQ